MSVLARSVKGPKDEITTPETFRKGEEFESYVRGHLLPKDKYLLLQRTHGYASNKDDFIESSKEPDFKFQSITSGRTFYVEAKYRSGYYRGTVRWCKSYQLRRYRETDRSTPVYIVIGMGEEPGAPSRVFFVPVKNIRYARLFPSFLRSYEVPPGRCICESQLQ